MWSHYFINSYFINIYKRIFKHLWENYIKEMFMSPLDARHNCKGFTPLFKTLFNISSHDHLGALVQHLFLWCLNNCYCLTDLLVDFVWILCSINIYLGMCPSYHLSLFLVVLCLPCAYKTIFFLAKPPVGSIYKLK
jgi:hypothetical protein